MTENDIIVNFLLSVLPYAGVLVGIILGALATHFFSVKRDIAVKRREIILDNLILAYEGTLLANTARSDGNLKELEHVIHRIQLVGNDKLLNLADAITKKLSLTGKSDLTPLFIALRDNIRIELKLSKLPEKYFGLVVTYPGDRGHEAAIQKRNTSRAHGASKSSNNSEDS